MTMRVAVLIGRLAEKLHLGSTVALLKYVLEPTSPDVRWHPRTSGAVGATPFLDGNRRCRAASEVVLHVAVR